MDGPAIGPLGEVFVYLLAITLSVICIRTLARIPRLQWLAGIEPRPHHRSTQPIPAVPVVSNTL
jgi:hypothetical protein